MTREERIARTNHLLSLYPQAKEILMAIPGVQSVDIGLKETGQQLTHDITFLVYVEQKKSPDELPPEQLVPDEVLGVKTDVLVLPKATLTVDTSEYRPIKGGIQIGNGTGPVGTMGCIATRRSDNAPVILSNHHVMFASGKGVNDLIGQADVCESCCCICGEIGTIVRGSVPPANGTGNIDAAIATIKAGISHVVEINQIGSYNGSTAAVPDDIVRKVGRTTGLTTGVVRSITADIPVTDDDGHVLYTLLRQVTIAPQAGTRFFANRGDSGSVVVNENNRVIALLWGVDFGETSPTFGYGFCNHIADVMTAMDITIPGNAGVGPASIVAEAHSTEIPTDNAVLVRRLERTLRQTEPGQAVLNTIQEFRFEVMNLINHNRAVGVTWQRRQGPAFVAALFRSVKEPSYRIPREIESVSARSLLMNMAAILDEHGSPRLREAINRHVMAILEAADSHDTIDGILEQLTNNAHAVALNN